MRPGVTPLRALAVAVAVAPAFLAAQGLPPGAAPVPQLEVALDPSGPVTVGLPLTVTFTLLVPSYMPQPPVWPDLQIADAITRQASGTSRPVTRRIAGATWAGVTRSYRITPQRAADYVFPEAQVAVTYADPATNAPRDLALPLPPVAFTASIPAAAAGLDPFVAATGLTLDLQVEGPGAEAKPGAAVTLRLVTEAQGTQAMLLPDLLGGQPVPAGLRAYPRQPELEDRPGERGRPDIARRVETVTYMVEAPGDYRLPAISLSWWNAGAGRVETAQAGPAAFSIPRPPGWQPPPTAEELARRQRRHIALAAGGVVLLAAGALLWHGRHRLRALWSRRQAAEPAAFRRLLRAAHRGELARLRPMLADWLGRFGAETVPPTLEQAIRAAERTVWGPEGQPGRIEAPARRRIGRALHDTRAGLRPARKAAGHPLPGLNPDWKGLRMSCSQGPRGEPEDA